VTEPGTREVSSQAPWPTVVDVHVGLKVYYTTVKCSEEVLEERTRIVGASYYL
jgi:hypothetical protein